MSSRQNDEQKFMQQLKEKLTQAAAPKAEDQTLANQATSTIMTSDIIDMIDNIDDLSERA